MSIKDYIRSILIFFHIDLTKNIKYDRLTKKIMKCIIKPNSNCIDIGCYKGDMLSAMISLAPLGNHYAFEPIPHLFNSLNQYFHEKAKIFPFALYDSEGKTSFNLVKNDPAYSGIKNRRYDISKPEIEKIEVELKTMDKVIPQDSEISFIKIDVEGAEFAVMKGGIQLLKRNRPIIVFECGLGASDYYGTKPEDLYYFLKNEILLEISLLDGWLRNKPTLTESEFVHYFNTNQEYYFIAHPKECMCKHR